MPAQAHPRRFRPLRSIQTHHNLLALTSDTPITILQPHQQINRSSRVLHPSLDTACPLTRVVGSAPRHTPPPFSRPKLETESARCDLARFPWQSQCLMPSASENEYLNSGRPRMTKEYSVPQKL